MTPAGRAQAAARLGELGVEALIVIGGNGTLSKDGLPVVLQVTEPLLRKFLDTMARLEVDLLQRWGTLEGQRIRPRAE